MRASPRAKATGRVDDEADDRVHDQPGQASRRVAWPWGDTVISAENDSNESKFTVQIPNDW